MKFVRCSLCSQEFQINNNPLLQNQKDRHEKWHSNCKVNSRNTEEGIVIWN